MKHVVLFSGGATSAFVAKIVIVMYGKENTILLHTPTYSEDSDADRFRAQVSDYLGVEMTIREDGRDIWQLIEDKHCLPSYFIPFCTHILKIEQMERYLKELDDQREVYTVYYGYDADEYHRVQKVFARAQTIGREVRFPLYELGIKDLDVKRIIRDTWRICLPRAYITLQHNNCVPCFKGGKGHFYAVWKYHPKEFLKAIEAEKKTGYTVFQDKSLEEYARQWESAGEQIEFDTSDLRPCMCAF